MFVCVDQLVAVHLSGQSQISVFRLGRVLEVDGELQLPHTVDHPLRSTVLPADVLKSFDFRKRVVEFGEVTVYATRGDSLFWRADKYGRPEVHGAISGPVGNLKVASPIPLC
jgi:hypothetical protein